MHQLFTSQEFVKFAAFTSFLLAIGLGVLHRERGFFYTTIWLLVVCLMLACVGIEMSYTGRLDSHDQLLVIGFLMLLAFTVILVAYRIGMWITRRVEAEQAESDARVDREFEAAKKRIGVDLKT